MLDYELLPEDQWLIADEDLLDTIRRLRKYLASNPSEELARILDELVDLRGQIEIGINMTLKLMTPVYRLSGVRMEQRPYQADRLGLGENRQALEITEILAEIADGELVLTPATSNQPV
jgi:hypothetical protein